MAKRILSSYSDEEFSKIVAENTSLRKIGLALGYSPTLGAGFFAIKKRIEELNLSTEHFTRDAGSNIKWTKDNAFQKGTTLSSTRLRKLFLEEHTQDYVCSICGQPPKWKGKPLTLILDHIDGDHTNNILSNLRWVCPNCNQQLETTGSKNRRQKIQQNYCLDCGTPIGQKSIHCRKCAGLHRKTTEIYDKLSRETLKEKIRNESFMSIAKEYGYKNGNSVKRWCRHYHLPCKKEEIALISDEEWETI